MLTQSVKRLMVVLVVAVVVELGVCAGVTYALSEQVEAAKVDTVVNAVQAFRDTKANAAAELKPIESTVVSTTAYTTEELVSLEGMSQVTADVPTSLSETGLEPVGESVAIEATNEADIASETVSDTVDNTEEAMEEAPMETQEATTVYTPVELTACSLRIKDTVIPYVYDLNGDSVPSQAAGLWQGGDSVSDGKFGYFVGHNPGIFAPVATLNYGDEVDVCDGCGNMYSYFVTDVFDVLAGTSYNDVYDRVSCNGESIALQTCIDGGWDYRIVVCC